MRFFYSEMDTSSIKPLENVTHGIWIVKIMNMHEFDEGIRIFLNVDHRMACQLSVFELVRKQLIKNRFHNDWALRVKDQFIGRE
jgi:hypothetical protein